MSQGLAHILLLGGWGEGEELSYKLGKLGVGSPAQECGDLLAQGP